MSEIQSTPAGAERGEIVSVRVIDAPREKVFKAFADPASKARWFVGPNEWKEVKRTLDFRPGGEEICHSSVSDRHGLEGAGSPARQLTMTL